MRMDFTDEFTGTPAEAVCSLLTQEGMHALNAILQGDYSGMSDRTFAEFRDLVALAAMASTRIGHLDGILGAFVDADGKVTPLDKEAMDAGVVAIGARPVKPPEFYELTPEAEALVRAFAESVPLTQDAVSSGSDALEREIERSFAEPLDAVPDKIAVQHDDAAEAVRSVVQANLLLALAADVIGPEAVDLLMRSLAVPEIGVAA